MYPGFVEIDDLLGRYGIVELPILSGSENDQWAISQVPGIPCRLIDLGIAAALVRLNGATFRCRTYLRSLRLKCFDSLITHGPFCGALIRTELWRNTDGNISH
jgi:hypothetical protein